MLAVREEPEFDMAMLAGQFLIAFAHLGPAALFDSFGKMKSGDDRHLNLGRYAEQTERQTLCLKQIGMCRRIAPARLAISADQPPE